jgi:hypothetical protein
MRKSVKRALGAGIVSGVAYAAWRAWNARAVERPRGVEWSSAPFPFPPVPRPATGGHDVAPTTPAPAALSPWVEPDADGACPSTHLVKAKLASGIYHVPGGANYTRTKPDRCYIDEAAAAADGLRASKV